MIPRGMIPDGLKYCIAGGYAACPVLATDIDVWVYGVAEVVKGDIGYRAAELRAHLEQWTAELNRTQKLPVWPEKRYSFAPLSESQSFIAYEHEHCDIEKVGVVTIPSLPNHGNKPYHIMVTNAPSPGEILSGFDISTHACAIDRDGRIWKSPEWTAPHQQPREILHNEHTPERMRRICSRFGHTYEEPNVETV